MAKRRGTLSLRTRRRLPPFSRKASANEANSQILPGIETSRRRPSPPPPSPAFPSPPPLRLQNVRPHPLFSISTWRARRRRAVFGDEEGKRGERTSIPSPPSFPSRSFLSGGPPLTRLIAPSLRASSHADWASCLSRLRPHVYRPCSLYTTPSSPSSRVNFTVDGQSSPSPIPLPPPPPPGGREKSTTRR